MTRDVRKSLILETFDKDPGWKGLVWYSKAFGVSRQYIAKMLSTERGEEYRRKRHPTRGRRTDLRG